MSAYDNVTPADLAGMLEMAARDGAPSGSLSCVEEAALRYLSRSGVIWDAVMALGLARSAWMRQIGPGVFAEHDSAAWAKVAQAARGLAALLRSLGDEHLPPLRPADRFRPAPDGPRR